MFEQIRDLTDRLNSSPIKAAVKQLTITDDDVSKAIQEAHVIFAEISKKADEILSARKAKGSS